MVETGFFYSSFLDPLLKRMREKVAAQISNNETVIDIACGTGAQVFRLAERARRVVGVDLSESMIEYANKQGEKQSVENVAFVVADATKCLPFADNEFDVATMSLALHQFPPEIYTPVLGEMKRISKRIILVDYAVPLPNNFLGWASKIIEFLAGREHNRCFRRYYKIGGLESISTKNGLHIQSLESFGGGAFYLANCLPA